MRERKIHKTLSVLIALTLLLGLLAPAAEVVGDDSTEDELDGETTDSTLLEDDYTRYITGTEYRNDTVRKEDNNIVIDGHLVLNNSTLVLRLDGYHPHNITIRDGGQLTLNNSTLTTELIEDDTPLRPFLKTNVSAQGGSSIELFDGSSFKFPGWVYLENSDLTLKGSSFEPLDEVPQYDYTWGESSQSVGVGDNEYSPALTATQGSNVLIEDSEIIGTYQNDGELEDMEWKPEDPVEEYVIGPGESEEIDVWNLDNPQFPTPGGETEYPYMNPFDKISALFLEIESATFEENATIGEVYYTTADGEEKLAFEFTEDGGEANVFEYDQDSFGYEGNDFIKEFTVTIHNIADEDEESNITINYGDITLHSAFDNDIRIIDSSLTIINSDIDIDYNKAFIDPDRNYPTDQETHLPSFGLERNAIRVYNSSYRSYGLNVLGDSPEDGDGDPWILNTDDCPDESWVYRWVELQITNEDGVPLPGATVEAEPDTGIDDLDERVEEINHPYNNPEAWEYLNETGYGDYIEENGEFVANEDGEVTLFLTSDRLDYPKDWPNSRYVGNYMLNLTYEDEAQNISVTATDDIGLEDFPTMDNPETINAQMPVPLPDLKAEELKIDGDEEPIHPDDEIELNMTVSNVGDSDAYNVTVSLYEDEFDWDNPDENQFDSTELERLNESESKSITFDWKAEETGTYTFIGVVDPENNITEKNTDNNEISITFDVVEEPFFEVEITDPSDGDNFVEGDEIAVEYQVTNTGGLEDTQNIQFFVENDLEDTEIDVTLEGGGTYQDDFTWIPDEPGEYNLSVRSEDDDEEITIMVLEEAYFEVNITAYDEEVVEGEDVTVEYNVTNTGEAEDTQIITFSIEGDLIDQEEFTLDGGEEDNGQFIWETEVNMAGDYFLDIMSDDDEDSKHVTVLQDAYFEVTINEQSDEEVVEGEEMDIYVDIENTGEQDATQTIELYDVEDQEIILDSEEVSLAPGDGELIILTWTTEINDAGDYTLQVASENDEDELEVTVLRTAEFTVEIDTEESDTEGVEGEDFVIVADIENIGEEIEIETQTIELLDEEDTVLDEQEISLGAGDTESVELIWQTELGDAGDNAQNFQLEVASDDDADRIIVELNPAPNLNFEDETWYIDGNEMNPEEGFELEEGDTLAFEAQIENEGGAPIYNALFEYNFPDGTGESEHIDVEADESVSVSAEWNVRVIDEPEISIWVNSTAEVERTHDEIIYSEADFDEIESTVIRFEDLNFPEQEMIPGDSYHFSGRVVRDDDDKPLENIEMTISIRSSPELVSETVSTDENGEFGVFLQIPEGAGGEYTVEFEAHTHEVQSTQESVAVETDVLEVAGIPWWLLLVIVAIAAGGAGSAFAYFKFFGVGEMVECGNCGATISADATSCPKCGVEFDMDTVKCSECSEWIPADMDTCPECGAEFVKTGKEVEDYTERMRKQYKKFIRKKKREAQEELGKELSQKEFMDWWKDKPSFVTFEDWLERKEKQRREGSIECPECGTLNSVDDAVCQKCGTSLLDLEEVEEDEEEVFLEDETEDEENEEELEERSEVEEEESFEEEEEIFESEEDTREDTQELEESDESGEEEEKVNKKTKKKVKKKVVKKPNDEEKES